ncbi:family 2 glycosyl transferase [Carboxydothermus islandicus]|uniref:Family 2 glycosyl transferase n=1 Tax=Carboxydothermus islandicus TaxID=661089 RepID=A0A1L8D4Q3_9THEO|nr:glycosyltransferase [Carboxydothermus islandicus]GAV26148.1 family 2 glycosyl transferase [Carboxydothermus islandicus]
MAQTTETREKLISACLIVKNEEDVLERCLKSLRNFVDEIVIVDTGSEDNTVEIAKKYADIIDYFPWNGDFAAARNASIDKASGEWIFIVDADEELILDNYNELQNLKQFLKTASIDVGGIGIGILNISNITFLDVNSIYVNQIRIFRNKPEYRYRGAIHEQIVGKILENGNKIHIYGGKILRHYGYISEIVQKKDKINRNMVILERELKKDPKNSFNRYNLGLEYDRIGKFDKAIEEYKLAVKYLPNYNVGYANNLFKRLVRDLIELKRNKDALKILLDVVKIYPEDSEFYYYYAGTLVNLKKYENALKIIDKAIAMGEPPPYIMHLRGVGSFRAWHLKGRIKEALGDYKDALTCYEEALKIEPFFLEAVDSLIFFLYNQLPREKAREEVKKRFSNVDHEVVIGNIAAFLGALKEYDLALEFTEKIPDSLELKLKKAEIFFWQKKFNKSSELLREIIVEELKKKNPFLYSTGLYLAVLVEVCLNDIDNAKNYYKLLAKEELLSFNEKNYILGCFLESLSSGKLKQVEYKDEFDREKLEKELWQLAATFLSLDKFDEFEIVYNLIESNHFINNKKDKFGKLFYRQEFYDLAAEALLEAVKKHEADDETYYILGKICEMKNLKEEAISFYQKALSEKREFKYYLALITLYNSLQRYEELKEILSEAIRKYPEAEILKALNAVVKKL